MLADRKLVVQLYIAFFLKCSNSVLRKLIVYSYIDTLKLHYIILIDTILDYVIL